MFLFSEDEDKRVSSLLSRLANYDDAIQPVEIDIGAPGAENGGSKPMPKKKANLGVLTGVYLPCIQNIFGVIIFIRMAWMTGTAGVPTFFAIVFLCCSVTFCTVSIFIYFLLVWLRTAAMALWLAKLIQLALFLTVNLDCKWVLTWFYAVNAHLVFMYCVFHLLWSNQSNQYKPAFKFRILWLACEPSKRSIELFLSLFIH